MIGNHFKTAWRSLIKNKGIGFLNITGLSIGMTASVLISLWVQNEISFDTYHADAGRIYRLTTQTSDKNWKWEGSPMLFAAEVKKAVPEINQITRLYVDNFPVFNMNGILQYEKQTAYIDNEWFKIFQYHFIEGSPAAFGQSPYSVILSAAAAKKYFGNQTAVGKMIQVDSLRFEVKGVVEDAPVNSSFQYRSFFPISALLLNEQIRENGDNWDNTDFLTFIKLAPGANISAATEKATKILQKNMHDDKNGIATILTPLKDMHFETGLAATEFEHGNIQVVYVFSVLGVLILFVACINYVNLTTAKASLRSKEVSIRKIVGAARRQLFMQFTTESLLISLLSLSVSVLLIYTMIPGFNAITGRSFNLDLTSFNLWKILGSTLGISLILNSIYPAMLLSSVKPLNIFRGVTVLKLKDTYLRKALVVVQFSVSILLITGTIVIYSQMHFIQKRNLGFDRSQIITVGLPYNQHIANKKLFMQTVQQQLLTNSFIENVSMVNQPVVRIGSATTGADWDGRDTSFHIKVAQLSADAELLKTMHFKMEAGRWFENSGESDRNNYILNETAVRELNIHQPVIGERFSLHGQSGQIIGVVKDFHFKSLHDKVGSLVIFNNPEWWNFFMIRTNDKNAAVAIQTVENLWKKMAPGIPMEYSFLDERFNDLYRQDTIASELMLVFAIIAVIISGMGLFGLAAFATEQRTREMGIRKILGASLISMSKLLSKDFVRLVAIAFIIASPLAWWAMTSWLENFAYRITMSWWMLGAAGAIALIIALVITNYHAVKAGLQNPVKSLRTE